MPGVLTLLLLPVVAFAQVEGVEIGQCDGVDPDPVTGQQLVYCCLDEIYLFQKEGKLDELDSFLSALEETRDMDINSARIFYESRYESSLHRKHGWTSFCGTQIPCHRCTYGTLCGNGVIQSGEECDDERQNSDTAPNACRTDCMLPRCGDYIQDTQYGEECDEGDGNADTLPDRCRTDCSLPRCGDGVKDTGEACDDGNLIDDETCTAQCTIPPTVVSIRAEEVCGDGIVNADEECDDGNLVSNDGCTHLCKKPVCGDGILQSVIGEECDLGSQNWDHPNAEWRSDCRDRIWGAGIVDTRTEQCDDGNDRSGDGCFQCSEEVIEEEELLPSAPAFPDLEEIPIPSLGQSPLPAGEGQGEGLQQVSPSPNPNPPPESEPPLPIFHTLRELRAQQRVQANLIAPPSYQSRPARSPETGPAAVIVVAAGAGFGWAISRRRK